MTTVPLSLSLPTRNNSQILLLSFSWSQLEPALQRPQFILQHSPLSGVSEQLIYIRGCVYITASLLQGMDLDEQCGPKACEILSHSSSVHSTPEKKSYSEDPSKSPDFVQNQPVRRNALKRMFPPNGRMMEHLKTDLITRQAEKETVSSLKKPQLKSGSLVQRLPSTVQSSEVKSSSTWICKNSACRAVLSVSDTFCKRCSCCICHLFDENKDPSLWLVCASESEDGDSCGSSCHLLCALHHNKVGVVDVGRVMQLDGSYCCASCGKVSRILGCWKKQLVIAKDARRIDVLCKRVNFAYCLFDGTSRFKHLHEIVKDVKDKLETEVGPLDGISAKMARGIVSRLSIACDIQKLISQAIKKADEWLADLSNEHGICKDDSLPAACRILFQEVTCSTVIILLCDVPNASSDHVKGYKIWYYKSRGENQIGEPDYVLTESHRRVLISNLQPCKEYIFKIVSFTDSGDLGHSEAKCFTKSVEVICKDQESVGHGDHVKDHRSYMDKERKMEMRAGSSDFHIRDLGKFLHLAWAQEKGWSNEFCAADIEKCYGPINVVKSEAVEEQLPAATRMDFDLNVFSVPDLNEELPPYYNMDDHVGADDLSQDTEKNDVAKSHDSGNSHTQSPIPSANGLIVRPCRERLSKMKDDNHDCHSSLVAGPPLQTCNGSSHLDGSFAYCIKIIRWLECEGYINKDFRLKLLTWFSLKSTKQERKIVNTFIHTLVDDPCSLAAQLVDSFSEILPNKKLCNGVSNQL
uniref:Fibronectin type-III domain-containing protein n=3 Tax=Kalanchoe fedtschenkoi TaxID=63787 RepID=A0A7N0TET0_KALFE